MNNRHLPAGPAMQGAGGPSVTSSGDMPTGPSHGGGGGGGGRGRRGPHHYAHQYHQPMHHFANYIPPYPAQYYPHMHPHPQYQNGAMQSPAYMPYQAPYGRSPPPMHQYVPMMGVGVQQNYSARQSQNSPVLSTPYQPPPVPAPIPPHTPSSTHSPHVPPARVTPSPQVAETVKPPPPATQPESPAPIAAERPPFRAPIPWLSRPEEPFPKRTLKKSRRKQMQPLAGGNSVELPVEQHEGAASEAARVAAAEPVSKPQEHKTAEVDVVAGTAAIKPEPVISQDHPSDADTTIPSTPTSTRLAPSSSSPATKPISRPTAPAVPVVPAVPKSGSKESKVPPSETGDEGQSQAPKVGVDVANGHPEEAKEESARSVPAPAPAAQKPKSWASLLSNPISAGRAAGAAASTASSAVAVGATASAAALHNGGLGGLSRAGSEPLAEALRAYRVGATSTITQIEPRGLTNGGNMCYMNSVLQVLLFCTPFYDFLDHVSKKAVHSFKSETPLIDAMIVFMREFRVIASTSVDQLQEAIKGKDRTYGDPLTPNFLYDEMKRSKWFATLEQGHQQDAEEFLGWLLQALDDECSKVMGVGTPAKAPSTSGDSANDQDGAVWLEVGPRQKSVITRSSGSTSSSPISKIFGGLLRSELRVPGLKPSITTEPYQPLQLDIGSPNVRNITDALKGLTSQEKLHGDFNSLRGKNVEAYKQVLIDELPPVLILHLKRFQFDAAGGTLKIAKGIGYPLELDIPREVLSRQKVTSLGNKMPRYRLFAVVYHHGKNASVGHYTVDVRRQDGSQWIRIDDTKIEPIRAEDVARGGTEDEMGKEIRRDGNANGGPGNRFGGMNDEDTGDEEGWKQVPSGANGGNKRWSSVVNGGGKSGSKSKSAQDSNNDKSVAYILFYQRI
ncbi:hypothetical protein jhhlp_006296 [Lomentospora prolificans]|uniref:Ubiquitin carboxyl-terminal hydrolase n=1 Tax=Lomentospora prolificans TaxID=41688 RepID=A0A2N3N5H3_9PEZI|nr:hypothetical protein jhhlp_006296 [Lomentospora prolificans]